MSLWAVSDEHARAWMESLYEDSLIHEASTITAVHQATLHALNHAREDGGLGHPFYWASFVAAGDWE